MNRDWLNVDKTHGEFPLPYRLYEGTGRGAARPLVLYLRGNAFLEDQRPLDDTPAAIALAQAGAMVVEADYGGPSQNIFPKTLECGFGALRALTGKRKRFGGARSPVFVAGDESGANLAATLSLKARDFMPDDLAGQVLLSPMIDPRMATPSFHRADDIGMRARWSDGWSHYLASAGCYQHPYAAPCLCTRLSGVVPALVMTADDDPLRDEALDYADRLAGAGARVQTRILPASDEWTGIYRGRSGRWTAELSAEFSRFLRELQT